jgi:predicted GTPase
VVDPHRAGHEASFYPGETNVRLADVVIINKVDTAAPDDVVRVRANVTAINPSAEIVEAESRIEVVQPELLQGRTVLAIEDGPTLTHGGMAYGAAVIGATRLGATLVDPRPFAVGELAETLEKYPHVGAALPAMGYGEAQLRDLEATVAAAAEHGAEAVAIGTPVDLAHLIRIPIPSTGIRYSLRLRDPSALPRLIEPVLEAARTAVRSA